MSAGILGLPRNEVSLSAAKSNPIALNGCRSASSGRQYHRFLAEDLTSTTTAQPRHEVGGSL